MEVSIERYKFYQMTYIEIRPDEDELDYENVWTSTNVIPTTKLKGCVSKDIMHLFSTDYRYSLWLLKLISSKKMPKGYILPIRYVPLGSIQMGCKAKAFSALFMTLIKFSLCPRLETEKLLFLSHRKNGQTSTRRTNIVETVQ